VPQRRASNFHHTSDDLPKQVTVRPKQKPRLFALTFSASSFYLLRCYAKNVKTDLTADEKKELRKIAAHLKGMQ
jgi:hypothetical protein